MIKHRAIVFALLVVSFWASNASSADIQMNNFEEGSIQFSFSNARMIQYEGQRAFSVDISATTVSWVLPKDVSFANMELFYYIKNGDRLVAQSINPILLNSNTYGQIIRLDPLGQIITDIVTNLTAVKGITLSKGATHSGALLFILPKNAILVHSIRYFGSSSTIRETPNRYIEIKTLDPNSVWNLISKIDIPSQLHMRLLDIYLATQAFDDLNRSLKSAW